MYVSVCIVHYATIVMYCLSPQSGLSGGSAGMVVEALSARYLDWSNQVGGIKRARAVYKRSVGSCKLTHNVYVSQAPVIRWLSREGNVPPVAVSAAQGDTPFSLALSL